MHRHLKYYAFITRREKIPIKTTSCGALRGAAEWLRAYVTAVGAAAASEPLHAVEAHEHAVAGEERHPHEHVAVAARLGRQKDEQDCNTNSSAMKLNVQLIE